MGRICPRRQIRENDAGRLDRGATHALDRGELDDLADDWRQPNLRMSTRELDAEKRHAVLLPCEHFEVVAGLRRVVTSVEIPRLLHAERGELTKRDRDLCMSQI